MNPFVGIVLALAAYSLIVFLILATLAWLAEGNEQFDQTITDHYQDKVAGTSTTGTLPPEQQP